MKLLLTITFLSVSLISFAAGNPFNIKGKVTGKVNGNYAYLQIMKLDASQQTKLIRAVVKDNQFIIAGEVIKVVGLLNSGRLFLSDKPALTLKDVIAELKQINYDTREIILDNTVSVEINESVAASKVVGSTENEINGFFQAIQLFENKRYLEVDELYKAKIKAAGTDNELLSKLRGEKMQEQIAVHAQGFQKRLQLVNANPESLISLRWMSILAMSNKSLTGKYHKEIEDAWALIPAAHKKLPMGVQAAANIKTALKTKLLDPGAMIPDHTFSYAGGELDLNSMRGKYYLIDFWASWCAPCRAEHYEMKQAYNQYKSKNFEIVQVSVDNKEAAWRKALAEDQLPWLNLRNENGWDDKIKEIFNFSGVPANYLVDPNGKIIGKNLRGKELAAELAKVLK